MVIQARIPRDFKLGARSQSRTFLLRNPDRLEDTITVAEKVKRHAWQRGRRDSDQSHLSEERIFHYEMFELEIPRKCGQTTKPQWLNVQKITRCKVTCEIPCE